MAVDSAYTIRFTDSQIEFLKWVAMATMLIDHSNKILFDGAYEAMMWIGRLSFPIFTMVMAYHYEFHTRWKSKYFLRLLIFAILSQPVYWTAFHVSNLNVLFTLAMGFALIWYYDHFRAAILSGNKSKIWVGLCLVAFCFAVGARADYFQCGIMMVPLAVLWLRHNKNIFLMCLFVMTAIANISPTYAFFALLSYGVIIGAMIVPLTIPRLPRYFYYLFYPAHMAALIFIARYFIP